VVVALLASQSLPQSIAAGPPAWAEVARWVADGTYDRNLCVLAQRLVVNAGAEDFHVRPQYGTGSNFAVSQMVIEPAAVTITVPAMPGHAVFADRRLQVYGACKMANRDRINAALGLRLPAPERECRVVNEFTYRVALSTLNDAERAAYSASGRRLTFAADYRAAAGAEWIPARVHDHVVASERGLQVRAPSVRTAWNDDSRDWHRGTHHCKLLTLAVMRRWMTTGAVAGDTALYPAADADCGARPAGGAGSCIFYFSPSGSTFCQDYSGTGWTPASAAAECAGRHATAADQAAAGGSHKGTGGRYDARSCAGRNAAAEVRGEPFGLEASGDFGTCVFRCGAPDEARWRVLSPEGAGANARMMARVCERFIPGTKRGD